MLDSQVLKRLDFPAYCIKLLDNGLVAITGGGGTSKTGVTNWIEIGHVSYTAIDHENFNTDFKLLAKLETADAIMKFVSFSSPLPPAQSDLYLAAAVNDIIEIYRIQPRVSSNSVSAAAAATNEANHQQTVRQRNTSTSGKVQNGSAPKDKPREDVPGQLEASAELKLVNRLRLRPEGEKPVPDESIISLQVYKNNETVMLCAGTSAGSIIVWNLEFEANNNLTNNKINVERAHEFKRAHGTAEIDELQVNTDGHLLSIGKDNKAVVWSLRKLTKVADVDYTRHLNDTNLRMKHARFSRDSSYLYTTYIPRVRNGSRNVCSYVQKWCKLIGDEGAGFGYRLERTFSLNHTIITSIQTSRDGHFVAVGDCDGKIYLFDSSFNRLKSFKKQHSSVITDLVFYHDCELTSSSWKASAGASQMPLVYDLNKLILTISIDRTIQLYKFINTSQRLIGNLLAPGSRSALTCCLSMQLFQFSFLLLVLLLLFCYFFTYIE